eukprot:SAG11_NODE_1364_length_5109_cov_2.966866_5_plen_201_part_00
MLNRLGGSQLLMLLYDCAACSGRIALQKAMADMKGSSREVMTPDHELDKLYLTDLLQRVIDDGMVKVVPVPVYGSWREVDTPHDLQRANNAMMYLNDQKGRQALVKQMGQAFLSEANDLKRPVGIMARELDIDVGKIEAFTEGKVEMDTAYDLMRAMSATYPVPVNLSIGVLGIRMHSYILPIECVCDCQRDHKLKPTHL